jgi:cyclopropane fatty-acyl-phospholipid synthase-like methyltransferase
VKERLREGVRAVEDWWFDTTRRVQTTGTERRTRADIAGVHSDSNVYGPVRVANARAALRDLPIKDYSKYRFIDIGSGKGRVLFVAAEFPFRGVVGVEFSKTLHEEALANLARYRHISQRCRVIESVHANAMDYEFPEENLVVYLFNPFGPEVMSRMLKNLERSLERKPRHVLVVMLWPENWQLVADTAGMKKYRQTRRYHVYETGAA